MAVKSYLCSKVEYININKIVATSQNSITIKDGYEMGILNTKKATFSESLSVSVNDYVTQSLSLSGISNQNNNQFKAKRFVFRITFTSGKQLIWGDLELPVRITSNNNNTNEMSLKFTRVGKTFVVF